MRQNLKCKAAINQVGRGHAVPNYLSGLQHCYGLSKSNVFNPAQDGAAWGKKALTDYTFKSKQAYSKQYLGLQYTKKDSKLYLKKKKKKKTAYYSLNILTTDEETIWMRKDFPSICFSGQLTKNYLEHTLYS